MEPKISVILPIYNMEKYLSSSLDSILKQTMADIEIICVNDGSTDSSHEILKKYQFDHKNIKVINQSNKGVGYSRNVGINAATGEFIAFLDPDDYLYSNHTYALLYKLAKENNVNICGGSLAQNLRDGAEIRTKFEGSIQKQAFLEEGIIDYKDYQFDYGFYRFIYNREFLIQNKIYFPEYIRFQDPPFFVHAMIKAGKFYAIKEPTYCYRSGHKPPNLSEDRICDLVRGLSDNLRMSSEANLKELHLLTLYRFNFNFKTWINEGFNKHSVLLMGLLADAQSIIRKDWLSDSEYKSVYEGFFEYFEEIKRYCSKKDNEIQHEKKIIDTLHKEIDDLHNRINCLEKERDLIYNSNSYKIGSKLMYIPHIIKSKRKK